MIAVRRSPCEMPSGEAEKLAHYAILVLPVLFFLAASLCSGPVAAYAEEAGHNEAFVTSREFRGLIRRDMAEYAARTAAEIMAMEQAARILVQEPDLQFANGAASQPSPLSLDGLARMVFATPLEDSKIQGFPPHVQAVVHVRLEAPKNLRNTLHIALTQRDMLEIYGQVLALQRSLVERYDVLATKILPLSPTEEGGKEEAHALQSVVNELKAMNILLSLMHQYSRAWDEPQKVQEELRKAHALAPANPLLLTALAELFLRLDRAPAAMEYVGEALRKNPGFARAHDVKGTILLRQSLPVLAAESFGKAIELAPDNAAYRVHRASAYLVLEEETEMCADFQAACGLGDCEGLEWAKNSAKCRAGQ